MAPEPKELFEAFPPGERSFLGGHEVGTLAPHGFGELAHASLVVSWVVFGNVERHSN